MTGWYSSSWKARSLEYGEGGGFPPPFSYATKQSGGDKTHWPPDTAARLRPTKQPVCFTTERAVCDSYKWMRAIVAGTTFQDNMDLDLFYDQESRNFSEHGYIGLYKDKSIRAIGKLKKTVIAVENNGSMTYRAESGAEPTTDEIERINEAIRRADHYGYNLRTISHRYFIVEKFYPMDFRKSSKNPIQKSKFFNLADMFGYKTMPNTDVIANDLNGRTWEEF